MSELQSGHRRNPAQEQTLPGNDPCCDFLRRQVSTPQNRSCSGSQLQMMVNLKPAPCLGSAMRPHTRGMGEAVIWWRW